MLCDNGVNPGVSHFKAENIIDVEFVRSCRMNESEKDDVGICM